jgi:FtsP/CotA-like multicopper oxidase with cupredoxin domain
LHFHGLHVSPQHPQDDVLRMMAMPGESLDYKVIVPPDSPPGLYWYHTHPHGESAEQDLDGMSGAIIVEGIERYYPELRQMRERVLILRDLGSARTLTTNVRLIAATNRDLSAMVEEGKFRSDLFFRLNVFPINLPTLRERREDIPLLVRHFAEEFSRRMNKTIETISPATMDALCAIPGRAISVNYKM